VAGVAEVKAAWGPMARRSAEDILVMVFLFSGGWSAGTHINDLKLQRGQIYDREGNKSPRTGCFPVMRRDPGNRATDPGGICVAARADQAARMPEA